MLNSYIERDKKNNTLQPDAMGVKHKFSSYIYIQTVSTKVQYDLSW